MMYPELRRIAEGRMRHEHVDHALLPTALVHEFFLQVAKQQDCDGKAARIFWHDRIAGDTKIVGRSRARPWRRLAGWQRDQTQFQDLSGAPAGDMLDALQFNELLDHLANEEPRMAKGHREAMFWGPHIF